MYRGDDDDDVCFYMQPLFVSHAVRCTVNRPVLKEDFTDHRETKASGCFSFPPVVLKQRDAPLGHYCPPDRSRSEY